MGITEKGNTLKYYQLERTELYSFARSAGLRSAGRALNVGCGAGKDAPHLRALGAGVIHGIEPVDQAAESARLTYDRVFHGRVEDWRWDGCPYDLVVFADVLEHMANPEEILRKSRSWLGQQGHLLISIPNVRHLSVIADLVFRGDWVYAEDGILDKTHLRFFTARSFVRLLSACGYTREAQGRWGATRTARTVARFVPRAGEFVLSQVFFLAKVLPE